MKQSNRNRFFHIGRLCYGIVLSIVIAVATPSGIGPAAAQDACDEDDVCKQLTELNEKLKSIRETTKEIGTLKADVDKFVSMSICMPSTLAAKLGGQGSLTLATDGEGGVGAVVLGNGIQGHLEAETTFGFSAQLVGKASLLSFPCIDLDEAVGDQIIETDSWDLDYSPDPDDDEDSGDEDQCPDCAWERTSQNLDADLVRDMARFFSDIPAVDVVNALVGSILNAGSALESSIGLGDDDATQEALLNLLSGRAVKTVYDDVSELSLEGTSGIAETAFAAYGRIREHTAALPVGDVLMDTIDAIDAISVPGTGQTILESIADPCGMFLDYSWCEDAKEVADKMYEVIARISKPNWLGRFEEIGPLSLTTENQARMVVNQLDAVTDKADFVDRVIETHLPPLSGRIAQWPSELSSRVGTVANKLRNGLDEVREWVCNDREADFSVGICSGTVKVNVCSSDPIDVDGCW